jgi:hypothetical protein
METQTIMDVAEKNHKPITIAVIWLFHYFGYCVLDPHKHYTWYGFIGATIFTLFFGFIGAASFTFMDLINGITAIVKLFGEMVAVCISIATLWTFIKKARKKHKKH